METGQLGRLLVVGGLVLACVGLLLNASGALGVGRLPGDLAFGRGNARVYVPPGHEPVAVAGGHHRAQPAPAPVATNREVAGQPRSRTAPRALRLSNQGVRREIAARMR